VVGWNVILRILFVAVYLRVWVTIILNGYETSITLCFVLFTMFERIEFGPDMAMNEIEPVGDLQQKRITQT
jgi:hypothetical protein